MLQLSEGKCGLGISLQLSLISKKKMYTLK